MQGGYRKLLEEVPIQDGWTRFVAIAPAANWESIKENGFGFRHRSLQGAAINFKSNEAAAEFLDKAAKPGFHPRLTFEKDNCAVVFDLPDDLAAHFDNPNTPKPTVKLPGTVGTFRNVDPMFLRAAIYSDGKSEVLPAPDAAAVETYRTRLKTGALWQKE